MSVMLSSLIARPNLRQPRRREREAGLVEAEDAQLLTIEGDGLAVRGEVGAHCREVVESGLGLGKEKLHEPGRGVIDEDEQRRLLSPPLEPVVRRAVDLDGFAEAGAALSERMQGGAAGVARMTSAPPRPSTGGRSLQRAAVRAVRSTRSCASVGPKSWSRSRISSSARATRAASRRWFEGRERRRETSER